MIPLIRQLLKTASNGYNEDAQQDHVIGINQIFRKGYPQRWSVSWVVIFGVLFHLPGGSVLVILLVWSTSAFSEKKYEKNIWSVRWFCVSTSSIGLIWVMVTWRCWYMIPPNWQLVKNRWVRCTLRSHNKRPCDGAWLFIPDQYPQRKSVFYLVASVLSLYFGFFFSHSFNETFCVTSTSWGKWSHEDDCQFGEATKA